MNCPRCGEEMKCPCRSCRDNRPDEPGTYWVDLEEDLEACGKCMFTQHIDWWQERDWALYKGLEPPQAVW